MNTPKCTLCGYSFAIHDFDENGDVLDCTDEPTQEQLYDDVTDRQWALGARSGDE